MAGRRLVTRLVGAVAALTVAAGPAAVVTSLGTAPAAQADVCYNGTPRLNPYLPSCTIPGPTNKIRGSAPDANAIIACRGLPGCLSYYVNNP